MTEPHVHRLAGTFVYLAEGGRATPLEVTERFWPDVAAGSLAPLGPGRLVSFGCFERDWEVWEQHPEGEELVCLLSGRMDLRLQQDGRDSVLPLREPGEFVLVPRGAWHTARVLEPASAFFVTWGDGTRHRPV